MTRPDKPVNDILIDAFCAGLLAQAMGKPMGHVERAAEITRQIHREAERANNAPASN